jgi:hypothetical protein
MSRSAAMKLTLTCLPVVALILSGCFLFSSKKREAKEAVASQCADILITWYKAERTAIASTNDNKSKPMYRFGKRDKEFRIELDKILKRYVDTGEDTNSLEFANDYFPEFISACTELRKSESEECYQFFSPDTAEKYNECVEPFLERSTLGFAAFIGESHQKHGMIDLTEFSSEKVAKLIRKAEIDPAGALLGH